MKILNFGSLNIDLIYSVPHIVKPGETLSADSLQRSAGGKGANQSVAMAKAGCEVWHSGTIGEDGIWLLDLLRKFNVKTDFIRQYDGPTGQAFIQVSEEGQNSIVLLGGGNTNNTLEHIEETLSRFDSGDYLVLQNEINLTSEIIDRASEKGMKICLNPAPYSENIKSWPLEKIDLLVVNEIEGQDLSGKEGTDEETLSRLIGMFPGTEILLTAGGDGAYYGYKAEKIHIPVVKVPVVDTTAAGDTFFGYYLASRIKGAEVRESMINAAKAASITVSRPGAMESIPVFSEL